MIDNIILAEDCIQLEFSGSENICSSLLGASNMLLLGCSEGSIDLCEWNLKDFICISELHRRLAREGNFCSYTFPIAVWLAMIKVSSFLIEWAQLYYDRPPLFSIINYTMKDIYSNYAVNFITIIHVAPHNFTFSSLYLPCILYTYYTKYWATSYSHVILLYQN